MSPQPADNPPHRLRKTLKSSALLALVIIFGTQLWKRTGRDADGGEQAQVTLPPRGALPPMPPILTESMAGRKALQRVWQDAMANDGRVLERGVAVAASGLSTRKSLQLALDEVFALGREQPSQVARIRPRANRAELEKFVLDRVASGAPATYPILYVKDAPRVPGNARIATGEIIAALHPGVKAEEIAREYGLGAKPEGSSFVGLTRFIARNAFRAMELVPKLAADPRIALVDHDLLKPVEPKAEIPNDPLFRDQWALQPLVDPYNIGIFPTLSGALSSPPLPNAAPVWGDFEDSDGGIRGRGIRVGIVDDGLEITHPDIQLGAAPAAEHRSYDMRDQTSPLPGVVLPPAIQRFDGLNAQPIKVTPVNRAHGVNVGGIIGARANNGTGTAGVAPNCTLVGIRAFSYALLNGQFSAPDSTFYQPLPGDLLSPTQDVIIAAAFAYSQNDFYAGSFPSKTVYEGTFYETDLASFSDSGGGPTIHVKNIGFGASDASGVVDGPGPEVAGYLSNGFPVAGAREKAVRDGRLGLGTVFVQPAGNGRFTVLDNSNNDGYANAREAITVGALARIAIQIPGNADGVSIASEWGANLTVVAPGGGSYWSGKTATSRANDGRPMRAVLTTAPGVVVPIATSDWTANDPAKAATATTPATPELFGLNKGGASTLDYDDGHYSRRFQGTSAAAAHVSGVVALMLEANPRLSWRDVQNVLIRTARNHLNPLAYALDPTAADPPRNPIDGVDINDPADPVVIDQDWRKNGGNLWFNHKYGAGIVDAGRAVAEAHRGILLPTQTDSLRIEVSSSNQLTIPDATASAPGKAELTFTPAIGPDFVITHVQLRIDKILAPNIGELGVTLVSPSGMESTLMEPRLDFSDDLTEWTFGSLRYWGENGSGLWKVEFRDFFRDDGPPSTVDDMRVNVNPPGVTGTLRVTLTLHGYNRPSAPRISRPASVDPDAPTIVEVVRRRSFNYSLTASGQPTTWFVRPAVPPDPPVAFPPPTGLPPGLRLGTVTPAEVTTYLPSRLITGETSAAVGEIYDVEVQAANAGGETVKHYIRFVVVPPPSSDAYTQWGDFFFPPAAVLNPLALGAADGEADGANNVLEYALGTSPVAADAQGATSFFKDGSDQWNFTFKRYPTRGVKYELQVSDTLLADSWVTVVISDPALTPPAAGADGVPVSVDADYVVTEGDLVAAGEEPQSSHRAVTVVNNPTAAPPLYYRLKVTPPRDPLDPR